MEGRTYNWQKITKDNVPMCRGVDLSTGTLVWVKDIDNNIYETIVGDGLLWYYMIDTNVATHWSYDMSD